MWGLDQEKTDQESIACREYRWRSYVGIVFSWDGHSGEESQEERVAMCQVEGCKCI